MFTAFLFKPVVTACTGNHDSTHCYACMTQRVTYPLQAAIDIRTCQFQSAFHSWYFSLHKDKKCVCVVYTPFCALYLVPPCALHAHWFFVHELSQQITKDLRAHGTRVTHAVWHSLDPRHEFLTTRVAWDTIHRLETARRRRERRGRHRKCRPSVMRTRVFKFRRVRAILLGNLIRG